ANRQVAAATGQTIQQSKALSDTWGALGLSGQALQGTLGRIGGDLDNNGRLLSAMGISTRDATGQLKTEGAVLLELQGHLRTYGNETDRAQALSALLGRQLAREVAPFFDLSKEKLRDYLAQMGLLGPVTDQQVAAAREWTRATK